MGYAKEIYRRAAKRLEQRRAEAARANDARAAEAAARLPQLEDIQRELAANAVAVTRLIVTSPERAQEELGALREKSLALQE
jgi:ribosomal protein L9